MTTTDTIALRSDELGPCRRCGMQVLSLPVFYRLALQVCAPDRRAIASLSGIATHLTGGVAQRVPQALSVARVLTGDEPLARAAVQGSALLCIGCMTDPELSVAELFELVAAPAPTTTPNPEA